MERDFMGLGVQVKHEIPEQITDSSIGIVSFDSPKEEKHKIGFEALGSAGLMTITTGDAVEPPISSYSSIMQQNMVREKQEYRYSTTAVTSPPKAFDSPFRYRYQEARRVASVLATSNPFQQSFISPAGRNLVCSTNPQPLPLTSPFQAKYNSNAVVGTTELRNTSISTGAPTQLTIFYAGSVYVYEDVSSEKAQAIKLLAGNGHPLGFPSSVPQSPVQTPAVRPSSVGCSVLNRSHNAKSSVSSQISLASMSVGGSVFPDDAAAVRTIGTLRSPPSKDEPPKAVTVPQFRKASLARFLEKRKERVINASPYSRDKRQSQDSAIPVSGSRSIDVNFSGLCPLPTTTKLEEDQLQHYRKCRRKEVGMG